MTVQLLHQGESQVFLAPSELTPALPVEIEAAVTAAWNQECARRPDTFNGVLMSAVEASPGRLLVRQSEYRYFVAQRREPSLAEQVRVNPVAVCGLVMTNDRRWLFGRRGAGVRQYPSHLEAIPSGTLDERAFSGRSPRPGLTLDPLACLLAELFEEAGVASEVVDRTQAVGLFLDVEERTYDLAYALRLRKSAADLAAQLAAGSTANEYRQMRAVPADEATAFMERPDVVPTTRLLWKILQNGKWGRD